MHAFDERSLAENAAAQAATVETARAIYGARPVVISPVTLKPRSEAVAAAAEPEAAPGALPAQVDPRQMSLFGAGWTVASVKYLAESGAGAITYYETTGWRGVIETEAGSSLPDRFPSLPGMVFPVYHVFADLAEWRGGELIGFASDNHVAVDGLAVRAGKAMHLLLANLTLDVMSIAVGPLPDGRAAIRRLHAANALQALTDPASYRAMAEPLDVQGGELNLELAPFEIARIDLG
jgi:hypothetical protein